MLNLQSKNSESLLYKKNSAIQLTKNCEYGLFPLLPTPYSLLPTPYSLFPLIVMKNAVSLCCHNPETKAKSVLH
ncbi:hypothetical protein [Moorena sp. SIO4A5]|uniref:hypothetical protein n=1 Tax=Moorena sp. SIO4A5 TaxID=2607838 RepID=UPI0013C8668A|nr:hypothetical protein [Moorena sp. SIO4A5]NEO21180.1 hypothetical protein [Moorena sp. SIO4A5]